LLGESWQWSLTPIPTRTVAALRWREEKMRVEETEMLHEMHYRLAQDRMAREQDLAERRAEVRRYARSPGQPSLRARMARRLFELAVAAEREETWRVVWEKLEARGRL
jgi:hypothetical protein